MKCKAFVLYYRKVNKRGDKIIFATFESGVSINDEIKALKSRSPSFSKSVDFDNVETCDGTVFGSISCHDEPDYVSSTYPELDVMFKCDTCGHSHYSNLPNKYTINEWLNERLNEME